jgi:hypothetical protein
MVPSPCPPCQGVFEPDTTGMAMAREILEAVHGNNNGIALMVNSPKQFYSPPVLSPPPPRFTATRRPPRILSSISSCHFFCAYTCTFLFLTRKDPALYISLGLLRHILYTRHNVIGIDTAIQPVYTIKSFQQVATFP